MSYVIGIDLGTTNSCAAVYRNGIVEIIGNDEYKRTTPSFVFYGDDGTIVGKEAINLAALKPGNGIYDSKRLIGRTYTDRYVEENMKKWPFLVVKGKNNDVLIQFKRKNVLSQIRAEEVSAEILSKIKIDAENFLKQEVKAAVITVPAYFSNTQRQATIDAAKIARLEVLKLINEPTAAALAFTENNVISGERLVLVFDLGGGTFDISLIKLRERQGTVLSINGDTHLGGRDFDNNLIDYCLEEIKNEYNFTFKGKDENAKKRGIRRLRSACEEVKKELSQRESTQLIMDAFYGNNVELTVTRAKFESININLFQRTIKLVENTLATSGISKSEIDDVVLVGGSTKIPKIRQEITKIFDGRPPNKSVNPDEAVAIGAALEAYKINQEEQSLIVDVIPLSLGIEIACPDSMDVFFPKNTTIPVDLERKYFTSADYQTVVGIRIYEGEEIVATDNILLGHINIEGITPKPKGMVEITVKLSVDTNGILHVKASENSKNITKELKIVFSSGKLSEEEIKKIVSKKLAEEALIKTTSLNETSSE